MAIGGAWVIAIRQKKVEVGPADLPTKVGLALAAGLAVAGLVWYFGFRASFLAHAHAGAAIAMFVLVWIVITINARNAPRPYGRHAPIWARIVSESGTIRAQMAGRGAGRRALKRQRCGDR